MPKKRTEKERTQELIRLAGGPTFIASIFGIHSQAVSQWERVPAERCLAIEEATAGGLTRYMMRPDIYGQSPRAAA